MKSDSPISTASELVLIKSLVWRLLGGTPRSKSLQTKVPHITYEEGTVTVCLFQMGRPRHREAVSLAQAHTAGLGRAGLPSQAA